MTSENVSNSRQVISNQFFYKEVEEVAPRYKYVKINMSNILGNSVAITATGSTQIQFKLPYNTVCNLAKSKLSCLFPVPGQGADTYSQLVSDCFPFGNGLVTFETGNGLQMLNLPESAKYTKIQSKLNTKMSDFLGIDVTNNPHPCNGNANLTGLGTAASNTIYEPQYYNTSGDSAGVGTGNAQNNVPIYYELGMFSNTILGLDKDLYFGQNDVYLKVTIQGTNLYAYKTTALSPATGVVATLTAPMTTLQNVYLWLAVEVNPVCIDQIHRAYDSGALKVLIDYPIVTKTTTPASTNQAIVIPFLPAMGHTLKKVIHTVWNSTENLATALDCENSAAQPKVTTYNTYLDSTKLQDDQINCATANTATNIYADDWRINQVHCRDSVLSSYSIYQKQWFHMDSFESPDMLEKSWCNISTEYINGFVNESRGIQWQFIATTTNAAYIHNNFAIFQRTLSISVQMEFNSSKSISLVF